LKRHRWHDMNGELVPVDCICSFCKGVGYFEGFYTCNCCLGEGLCCGHTMADHQEMLEEEKPLEDWQKAWLVNR
jgi:hypothetical protein